MKTKFSFFLLLFFLNGALFSQTPIIEWQKSFGGGTQDYGHDMQQTSDGGYILTGTTYSDNGDITHNYGYQKSAIWIIKTDALGDTLWTRVYGGSSYDESKSIQQTSDGGYLVVGRASSVDYDLLGRDPEKRIWILKLDTNGDKEWSNYLSGDYIYNFAQTIDGGYMLGGYSSEKDYLGNSGHGRQDYFLAKLDNDGTLEWSKLYGGSEEDWGRNIIQTLDTGYLLIGHTGSNDGDVSFTHSSNDEIWIIKTDKEGTLLWEKSLGGTDNDHATDVFQKADSSYIVLCQVASDDGDVSGSHGFEDFWLVHLDKSGTDILKSKTFGGTGSDRPNVISPVSDGGYYIAGDTYSNNNDVLNYYGNGDLWILKVDDNFDIVWSKNLGGTEYDVATSVQETTDGGIAISGTSGSWNEDLTKNNGYNDVWLVKLKYSATSLFNINPLESIKITPNPASDWLFINQNNQPLPLKITLTTISGKVLQIVENTNQNEIKLDLSKLSSGVYLLNMMNDSYHKTIKFIKE